MGTADECLHDMTKRTFPQTREGSFMKCKICKMAKNGAGDGVPGAGGTWHRPKRSGDRTAGSIHITGTPCERAKK